MTVGGDPATIREIIEYGEGVTSAELSNLRGKPFQQWDTAGRVTFSSYDFKGNLLASTRHFWDRSGGDTVAWASTPDAGDLESSGYTTSQTYDALNRPVSRTTPDSKVTAFSYDEGGQLLSIDVDSDPFVSSITYNPRGQRDTITYGNGVSTTHSHDPLTFRLTRLQSVRDSDDAVLQDLRYTYDPVGNITRIQNDADDDLYFDNTLVTPHQNFVYDALYRLIEADGREKASLGYVAPGAMPAYGALPDTNTAVQRYTQAYDYDPVGNILEMSHFVATSSPYNWTRAYSYASDCNRLESTTVGSVTDTFTHDDRGSIVYFPHLYGTDPEVPNVTTDFRDQMVRVELPTSGQYALYWYDAGGQRVRKVVVKGAVVEERRYVGGFEVWTKHTSGTLTETRTTLHVMDGQQRIAMIETGTSERVRYQLGNHLGTACLELDQDGEIISYEEYHPYGTTAWQAPELVEVSAKRYRYTGMERDEETGFQCHGVRYYLTWLGRWGSADPIGLGGGVNRFGYCCGNPADKFDISGLDDESAWATSGGSMMTRNQPVEVTGETEEWMFARLVVSDQWDSSTAEEAMRLAGIDTVEEVLSLRRSAENGVATLSVESDLGYAVEYRLAVPTLSRGSRAALGSIADDVELGLAVVYAPAPISARGAPYASPGDGYTHFHLAYKHGESVSENLLFASAFARANAAAVKENNDNMRAQAVHLDTVLGNPDRPRTRYGLLWHTTFDGRQDRDHRGRVLLLPLDPELSVQTAAQAFDKKVQGWTFDDMEFSVIYGARSTPLQGITLLIDTRDPEAEVDAVLKERNAEKDRRRR